MTYVTQGDRIIEEIRICALDATRLVARILYLLVLLSARRGLGPLISEQAKVIDITRGKGLEIGNEDGPQDTIP